MSIYIDLYRIKAIISQAGGFFALQSASRLMFLLNEKGRRLMPVAFWCILWGM